METGVSGFRTEGTWEEIVEHGERLAQAMRAVGIDQMENEPGHAHALAQFEAWRPKRGESLDEEISERTAEQASVSEGEGEEAGVSATDDIKAAGSKLDEATDRLTEKGIDEALDAVGESVEHASRAADTASRRLMRALEDNVYEDVMTQFSPYYFDNELISANISRANGESDHFVFEVNVNDDTLKEVVTGVLDLDDDADG
jgi:hypothetical protein